MTPLAITDYTLVSALGHGRAATFEALVAGRSGLARRDFETAALGTWVGVVDALDAIALPAALAGWDCRNNRLAEAGLRADGFAGSVRAAAARWGGARVGVFVGTSTSGILHTEIAYRHRDAATGALPAWLDYEKTHNTASVARYVRAALGLAGPAFVVSTACSSSAKVFALAERWLRLGLVDAAIVGGVDALCASVLYGFHALGLVSPDPCRPFDRRRNGISIGEAAGFALLERGRGELELIGHGEASDAFHMSSPHPEGLGAQRALDDALARAGLDGAAIDYVNLHGTASPKNDEVEAALFARRYGPRTRASATKGLAGHTMGAAGMHEAAICLVALRAGLLPGTPHCEQPDAAGDARLQLRPGPAPLRTASSHSFGFGGSNAVLVFGRGDR